MKTIIIPVSEKMNLTLNEAAAYFNIGVCKIRELTESSDCPFVLWVGNRWLIKRKLFEKYLEHEFSI